MAVHLTDPGRLPDSAFEPGTLAHLVAGNRGRLLDPRRTPVSIVGLDLPTGHVVLRVEGFEDEGALWKVPFEGVNRYQFERGSLRADAESVSRFETIVRRLDRPLRIPIEPQATRRTTTELSRRQAEATAWLRAHSRFLAGGDRLDLSGRHAAPALLEDMVHHMEWRGTADIEAAFATQFVSNPYSGELVKGHRIVLAQLGLVEFEGTVVRDPGLFDGDWNEARRADHVLARLAFVRSLFALAGVSEVILFRGMSFPGPPGAPRNDSFVSASFDFEVARSCFAPESTEENGLIMRQVVPVERLFMTCLETEAMNRQFAEAEAVLLHEPGNRLF